MTTWFAWSVLTIAIWGVWGFVAKMALRHMRWQEMLVVTSAAYVFLYLVLVFSLYLFFEPSLQISSSGVALGVATAVAGAAGIVPFYLALNQGNAAIVVPFTAVYPVITVLLSIVFLRETLSLSQVVAVMMFLGGTILVSRS